MSTTGPAIANAIPACYLFTTASMDGDPTGWTCVGEAAVPDVATGEAQRQAAVALWAKRGRDERHWELSNARPFINQGSL